MSLTGSGPDDPQRVGVPDRRPAVRHVRRLRRARRAARAGPHRRGHGRAYVAARGGRRRARLPGHPVDRGRRGRPRAGQPPPVDRALRAVPLPRRRGADRRRQRGPVAASSAPASGSTPTPRAWPPTASGSAAASRSSRSSRQAFADWDAEPLLARLAEVGRAGRQGAHPRRGLRVGPDRQPGPAGRRRAPDARRPARCPARRCGSSTPTAPRSTRRDHVAPPTARPARRRRSAPGSAGARASAVTPALDRARAARPGARRRAPSQSWDEPDRPVPTPTPTTAPSCEAAAAKSGTDESVLTGRGRVRGRPVAVVVNEFALPRRLDRPGRRGPDHRGRAPGDRRGAARCWPAPRPAAPACRRARPRSCGWSRSPAR